jgi:RNA polymerase sigma-70 factor (ECF subfamily)
MPTMRPATTEATTVAALRAGDEAAFVRLVEANHSAMVRLAMGFVHNRATAEEVVQESWLGFLQALTRFEGRSSLRTFLFTIVANKARTRAKREARSVPLSSMARDGEDEPAVSADRFLGPDHDRWPGHWSVPPTSWAGRPEQELLGRETMDVVRTAIDALPPRQRVVILLHDVHGVPAEEARRLLELTDGNHRVLLHRARSRVRTALEDYLDDPVAV